MILTMVYEHRRKTPRVYSESRYDTHGLVFVLRPLAFFSFALSSRPITAATIRSSSIYSSDSHRSEPLRCKTPARTRRALRCALQQPPLLPIIIYFTLALWVVTMAYYTTYNSSTEPSSSSLAGWAGVPEHAGQASTNFDDGLANISPSNCDDTLAQFPFSSQPDKANGCMGLVFPSTPSFSSMYLRDASPATDMLTQALLPSSGDALLPSSGDAILPPSGDALLPPSGDALLPPSSNVFLPPTGNAFLPPSGNALPPPSGNAFLPPSGNVFINAPRPSMIPELEFRLQGDEQVGHLPPSSDYIPYGEPTFFFAGESAIKMPPPISPPFAMGYIAPANDYGNIGYGYPLMQHMVGAAGAGPSGLMTGVDMNVGMPAFTFTGPGPAQYQYQSLSQVDERFPVVHVPERSPDVIEGGSATNSGVGAASEPKKKRQKQDRTTWPCPYGECDAGKYTLSSLMSVSDMSSQFLRGAST